MIVRKVENKTFYIPPSEIFLINITFTPDSLGIWSLKYHIKTLNNVTVKTGTLHFAVSLFEDNLYGLRFWNRQIFSTVTTDKEIYFRGENVTYTVHVWNRGDKNHTIVIAYGLYEYFCFPMSCSWGYVPLLQVGLCAAGQVWKPMS